MGGSQHGKGAARLHLIDILKSRSGTSQTNTMNFTKMLLYDCAENQYIKAELLFGKEHCNCRDGSVDTPYLMDDPISHAQETLIRTHSRKTFDLHWWNFS